MRRRIALFVVAGAAGLLPALPAVAARLTPANITATFGTGLIFVESNVRGETYNMVFRRNGTAQRTALSTHKIETGTWRAVDPGYCTAWAGAAERCFSVEKANDALTFDVYDDAGIVVAHWRPTLLSAR